MPGYLDLQNHFVIKLKGRKALTISPKTLDLPQFQGGDNLGICRREIVFF